MASRIQRASGRFRASRDRASRRRPRSCRRREPPYFAGRARAAASMPHARITAARARAAPDEPAPRPMRTVSLEQIYRRGCRDQDAASSGFWRIRCTGCASSVAASTWDSLADQVERRVDAGVELRPRPSFGLPGERARHLNRRETVANVGVGARSSRSSGRRCRRAATWATERCGPVCEPLGLGKGVHPGQLRRTPSPLVP